MYRMGPLSTRSGPNRAANLTRQGKLMDGDGFDLTIWTIPHHGRLAARLAYIDSDLVAEGLPGGAIQLGEDLGDHWEREPVFVPGRSHRMFTVTKSDLFELASLMEATSVNLGHRTRTHAFGETIHGLRLSRDFREVSISWSGAVEDEVPSLAKLFRAAKALSER